jgi:hypothetical protein
MSFSRQALAPDGGEQNDFLSLSRRPMASLREVHLGHVLIGAVNVKLDPVRGRRVRRHLIEPWSWLA